MGVALILTAHNEASGEAIGTGSVQGDTWGASGDGAIILPPTQWTHSTAESRASTDTSSRGQSESQSESESVSEVPMFIPIFGEERSSVQYSPLEEQRFQAEQRIMMQKDRHATARFLDMNTPVEIRTPDVSPLFVREGRVEKYRLDQLAKLPYVLSCDEALARLEKRQSALVLPSIAPETEPVSYRRRMRASAKSGQAARVRVDTQSYGYSMNSIMTTHKETITARELSYTALFEPAEEGGYVVLFPAIPNLMTQGETINEAKEMALECLQCYLESLQEDNLPIPEERYAALEKLRVTVPKV